MSRVHVNTALAVRRVEKHLGRSAAQNAVLTYAKSMYIQMQLQKMASPLAQLPRG